MNKANAYDAMKITQQVLSHVQQSVKQYENSLLQGEKVDGPVIIEPTQHLNPDFRSAPNIGSYVHPRVIIWDPLQQHNCFNGSITCPHYDHGGQLGSILSPCKWKDEKTERDM